MEKVTKDNSVLYIVNVEVAYTFLEGVCNVEPDEADGNFLLKEENPQVFEVEEY